MKKSLLLIFLGLLLHAPVVESADNLVRIGSKKFTEGYLLAEMLAQLAEKKSGLKVERRFGLGGTVVCFEALKTGAIDLYPEYTGTALKVLLKTDQRLSWDAMQDLFRSRYNLEWLGPFGFNNSYALAIPRNVSDRKEIRRISDLTLHRETKLGLSHEFLHREDGWEALKKAYHLDLPNVKGLEHGLSYEALVAGEVDVIDVWTTDGKLTKFDLTILEDDQDFFPQYLAAPLVRTDLLRRHPELHPVLNLLEKRISDDVMRRLNAEVEGGKTFEEVAMRFLEEEGLIPKGEKARGRRGLLELTTEHLGLTFLSLALSILVGVPTGILISRSRFLERPVLGLVGILQTIPGIALLAFMIPFFGIGRLPAVIALFLYGLLPIVRNTDAGLREVSPLLLEAADGIGLTSHPRLRYIELPLAIRLILAGIRTSAVINIGTATLAAFIGAGGLGEPIVTGLALNDSRMILSGAVPAAGLAIGTEIVFEWVEKRLTPRGLRIVSKS
jgi:osmoprotectant transport system permease protein